MKLPSLIDRELRCAARNSHTYRFRFLTALLMGLVSLAFVLPGAHNVALVGANSRGMFWWMAALTLFYGVVMALFQAGDAIASERRERTLELLQLTRLSAFEITVGKLIATGIGVTQCILAFSLALAMTFLSGGVTLVELGHVLLAILNTLFLALAIGLFASTQTSDGRIGTLIGLMLLGGLTALPLLLTGTGGPAGNTGPYNPSGWELLSPIATFSLAQVTSKGGQQSPFATGIVIQHGLAWFALLGASLSIWRNSHRAWTFSWRSITRRWHTTNASEQPDSDELEDNPLFWLLSYRYGGTANRLLMAFVFLMLVVGLFGTVQTFQSRTEALFVSMMATHFFMKLWVAWIASHLVTEMRRSGMLELTLTSPLDWHLVIDGWLIGLKRVFFGPVAVLLIADFFMALTMGERLNAAFGGHSWMVWVGIGMFSLLLESYALTWTGLQFGMSARNSTQAWVRAVGVILFLPWFCVASLFALGGVWVLPSVTAGVFDVAVTRFVFGLLITIGTTAWAIDRLRHHSRESLVRA